jgi:hypothetical protein
MKDRLKHPACIEGRVELAPEDVEDRLGRHPWPGGGVAVEEEIDRIVARPFDGDLHHAGRAAVGDKLVGLVIGHQRTVVGKAHLRDQIDGVGAEIPVGRAVADRADTGHRLQRVAGAQHQVALGVAVERRVVLVQPAMHADLVSAVEDPAKGRRVDQTGDGGHEEAGAHVMARQNLQHARRAHAAAELAPGQPADGGTAGAKLESLVVAVEGQGHGAARVARPVRRLQGAPRAHAVNQRTPFGLGHLPWPVARQIPLSSRVFAMNSGTLA